MSEYIHFVPCQMLSEKYVTVSVTVTVIPRDYYGLNSYKQELVQETVAAIAD